MGVVRTGALVIDRKYNWNRTHPSTFYAAACAMKRGGYRWRFQPSYSKVTSYNAGASTITVGLPLDPASCGASSLTTTSWTTFNSPGKMEKEGAFNHNGFAGMAAGTSPTEVVDVVLPMQTRFLAEGTNTHKVVSAPSTVYYDAKDRVMQVNWSSIYSTNTARLASSIKSYVSADTDFDVFYFINTPRLYELGTLPTAQ
jgi:hypothetical protein